MQKYYYPQEAYPSNSNQQQPIKNNQQPNISNLLELLGDKNFLNKIQSNTSPQLSMLMGLLNQNKKKPEPKSNPTELIKVSDYKIQNFED